MTKKLTHKDVVGLHIYFCLTAWMFGWAMVIGGSIAVNIGNSLDGNPWMWWVVVVAGVINLIGIPIRAWVTWPERDEAAGR